ncbi:MAG: hypothetical protein Q8O64_05865 [Sideroxyarcus sp.]|nr:hypothetical protein [Sideroxyarcus sp.]
MATIKIVPPDIKQMQSDAEEKVLSRALSWCGFEGICVLDGHSEVEMTSGLHEDGCVYSCSDPECNMPTFGDNVTCCEHCGKTEHYYSHPGGSLDKSKKAFVCNWCGEEYETYGSRQLRKLALESKLPECVPEFVSEPFKAAHQ